EPPERDQPRAERAGQEDLVVGGHLLRPRARDRHLRNELQEHAGTRLAPRIPLQPCAHARGRLRPVAPFQAEEVAVSAARAGWAASRILVPGTVSQLGAFGLFAP